MRLRGIRMVTLSAIVPTHSRTTRTNGMIRMVTLSAIIQMHSQTTLQHLKTQTAMGIRMCGIRGNLRQIAQQVYISMLFPTTLQHP